MLKFSLVGNPNVGKTSLYNRVTNSFEHVGNWHGVTVEKKEKIIKYKNEYLKICDLPGLYSLSVYSIEEEVARNDILLNDSDVYICVCEVSNLSRNLYLALQLLEKGVSVVVVLNMMDELDKKNKIIDYVTLSKKLNVPVVPMSIKYKDDANLLLDTCINASKIKRNNKTQLDYLNKLPLNNIESIISGNCEKALIKKSDMAWHCIKVLEQDEYIIEGLNLTKSQQQLLENYKEYHSKIAEYRYEFIDKITLNLLSDKPKQGRKKKKDYKQKTKLDNSKQVIDKNKRFVKIKKWFFRKKHNIKDIENPDNYIHGYSKIDKVVLNKYLALPIFLGVMCIIFLITFGLIGKFLSNGIQNFIDFSSMSIKEGMLSKKRPLWITLLITDGIINGVGGILAFLPQIVLLFFFLALLEDSGYISRVAFMTDGLFRKIGLSGRSAFTMLMGFGCSATAVLTARGLEDRNTRKKTVILTPFMSCSARLPVYTAIASAFFLRGQVFLIFGLYILGVIVAFSLASVFERTSKKLKSGKLSFIMEMPPYRIPTFTRVYQLISNNVKTFLIRIGTVILSLNIIIWIMANFSLTHGYTVGTEYKSILETTASLLAPLFKPLGFGSWRAVSALIGGLIAKESVIGIIQGFDGGINSVIFGEYAVLSALSFLVFTLLYVACVSTLSAIKKELGLKWMLFSLVLHMSIAYIISLIVYWIGRLFLISTIWGIAAVCLVIAFYISYFYVHEFLKDKNKNIKKLFNQDEDLDTSDIDINITGKNILEKK